jgi:hypothetical protein
MAADVVVFTPPEPQQIMIFDLAIANDLVDVEEGHCHGGLAAERPRG